MSKKTILVIGSEGNIGKPLVQALRRQNHEVWRCDKVALYQPDYIQADIVSPGDLTQQAIRLKPDVIYHLAAMVSRVTCEAAPHLTIDTNLCGLNNVVQLSLLLKAKLIYFSTSEVYGDLGGILDEETTMPQPNNRYGLSKYLGELLVKYEIKTHSLKAVIVRPFMFYDENETLGDHRSAMIRFAENLASDQGISVHEKSERAWMHISDATEALVRVMDAPSGELFNIGNPERILTEDLARYLCSLLGKDPDKLIKLEPLPPRMTLVKRPSLHKQETILKFTPKVSVREGARRVLSRFVPKVLLKETH